MIKKIIGLIGVVLLLTGCTVDYNLNIKANGIDEEIILNDTNIHLQPYSAYYDVDSFSETGTKFDDIDYYNESIDNNSVIFSYNFGWNDYYRSRAVRTCLNTHSISEGDNNTLILNTSVGLSCFNQYPNMSKLNINITLDINYYEMISSNADSSSNNTYTWVVDANNYDTKYIQLVFGYKKVDIDPSIIDPGNNKQNNENEKDKNIEKIKEVANNNFWLVITGSFIVMIIGIFIVIKVKSRKR